MSVAQELSGCVDMCPHLRPVKGTCEHQLRPLISRYLTDNPEANCPIFEEFRAEQMEGLADQLTDEE